MGKKIDLYQPPMRFRLRPRSGPAYGMHPAPNSGSCWRCFFYRLPAIIALLLASFVLVSSYSGLGAVASAGPASTIVQDASGQPILKVRIMGYWKEVRESLGLAPLQDTFLWTSSLLRDTEGGRNVLGLLQGGTGHASN